jgi:hypothetical protein
MGAKLNPTSLHTTAGAGQGIAPPTHDQIKAVLESTIAQRVETPLNPSNPKDRALINAFRALPASQKYGITKPGEVDDTRSAGVLKDGTIVVQMIGYAGFPLYSTAGKFNVNFLVPPRV